MQAYEFTMLNTIHTIHTHTSTYECTQAAGQGDAISLVAEDSYCEEQVTVNPATGNSRASGHILVTAGGVVDQVWMHVCTCRVIVDEV